VSYYSSVGFRSMKAITQGVYRNIIDRFCREKDREAHEHGDKRAATLQREHVLKLMAARADKPDSANGLRKVLRAMMKHAVETRVRTDDPTRDIKAMRPKSRLGFHRWTEAEIAQFEQRHPIGTKPRLALALGL
jgi:site-specific recombinase XerD